MSKIQTDDDVELRLIMSCLRLSKKAVVKDPRELFGQIEAGMRAVCGGDTVVEGDDAEAVARRGWIAQSERMFEVAKQLQLKVMQPIRLGPRVQNYCRF